MCCHSLLACRVSAERSAVNLMGIPLYVNCCFSVAAFNIFSLYLIFDSLINFFEYDFTDFHEIMSCPVGCLMIYLPALHLKGRNFRCC